jgi:hypothetical protein
MHDSDKIEFLSQVNGLMEVFSKPKLTASAAQVWWTTIRDLDHNDVFAALGYWAQSNSRPPAPRDIWTQANDARTGRLETNADQEARQNRNFSPSDWRGATPQGKRMLRAIQDLVDNQKPTILWPDKVLSRVLSGESMPYISRKWAADYFAARDRRADAERVMGGI